MKILVIDVGGTNVKVLATGQEQARKVSSGPTMTAQQMVEAAQRMSADWEYDAVSIGYPGQVLHNRPVAEPHNLAPGWVGFDFESAFRRPVKLINDAAMQALGSYQGGRMLFLGLGTGLGSTLIIDDVIAPLELAHLPYRKSRTYEDYLGRRGLLWLGKKKWREAVNDVSQRLKAALQADDVVLGGGHIRYLKGVPEGTRLGDNANAFIGGYRLWRNVEGSEEGIQAWRRASATLPAKTPPARKKAAKARPIKSARGIRAPGRTARAAPLRRVRATRVEARGVAREQKKGARGFVHEQKKAASAKR